MKTYIVCCSFDEQGCSSKEQQTMYVFTLLAGNAEETSRLLIEISMNTEDGRQNAMAEAFAMVDLIFSQSLLLC